jgi:hypothetical protein
MKSQRWLLLVIAAASAASATLAIVLSGRRRRHRHVQLHDHKADVGSWENEGGNLAPVVTVSAP